MANLSSKLKGEFFHLRSMLRGVRKLPREPSMCVWLCGGLHRPALDSAPEIQSERGSVVAKRMEWRRDVAALGWATLRAFLQAKQVGPMEKMEAMSEPVLDILDPEQDGSLLGGSGVPGLQRWRRIPKYQAEEKHLPKSVKLQGERRKKKKKRPSDGAREHVSETQGEAGERTWGRMPHHPARRPLFFSRLHTFWSWRVRSHD